MRKYQSIIQYCFTLFFLFSFTQFAKAQVEVTFHVDMQAETVAANGVHLAGTFNGWMPFPMNDDGDGTWSLTVPLPTQTDIQYRFYNGNTNADAENGASLAACGEPTSNDDFNRSFFVQTAAVNLPLVCFASCNACPESIIGTTQYINACLGEMLRFCVDVSDILQEPLTYQWFNANGAPITNSSNDPCYTISEVNFDTPLFYYCEIMDNSGQTYTHRPFILDLLEEDAIGGKYYANQFIVRFSTDASPAYREQVRQDFQAELLDGCMCTLELWELPDELEYPLGEGNIIIDDEEKKQTVENDPEIEEVDFNYQTNEEPLLSNATTPGTSTNPPDELTSCAALFFNGNGGSDDYVEISPDPSDVIATNDFTIEAWIKGNATEQVINPLILSNRNPTNISEGFMFFLANPSGSGHRKLTIQLDSDNYPNPNTPDVLDGECHHVAITKAGNQLLYYIDGLLNYSRPIENGLSIASPHPLWMGKDPISLATTPFKGLIEEVRIWDVARTDEEILQTAKYTLRGNENNLLAYWDIKEFGSQIIQDKTNNGYDGLLGGNVFDETTDPMWVEDCCYKKPVLTAIIDGGMQYDHPDLIHKIWLNPQENSNNLDDDGNCAEDDIWGYSYAENHNNPYDATIGHGSHVGGLAIKTAEGNFGNPTHVLKTLNLKVFDDKNKGTLFDAACAILHAADKKAKVINCSWGYYGLPTDILSDALKIAGENCGALVITSAGNSTVNVNDSLHYPGNHNEVFSNMLQVASADTIRDNQFEEQCIALYFDGIDDLVEIPDPYIGNALNMNDFTMEAWINAPDEQMVNPLIFSNYNQNEGFRFLFLNTVGTASPQILALELEGHVYAAMNTPLAFDNHCHHVAAVRSNSQLLLYMDGNLLETFDLIGNPDLNSSLPLRIGQDQMDPANYQFKGLIEEARFWNIALSASQIQNNFQNQINSSSSNLIAYFKMNEFGQGKILDEVTGAVGFLGRNEETGSDDPQWVNECCVTDNVLVSSSLNFQLAPYSNYSDDIVDIATWGRHHSTVPMDDMGWKIGTSMSSGVIAGVAARLFYENPAAQWQDVKQCILDNASNEPVLIGYINNERFFDPNINLSNAIDCIRSIIPNTNGTCATILALEFLNFEGQETNGQVLLNWDIMASTPIAKFDIERLNKQDQWVSINTVIALNGQHQKQSYQSIDKSPFLGENFYRLKIINEDGKIEESPIVMVNIASANSTWQIYPNPANDLLQIEGIEQINENTLLYVYNYAGIELKRVSLTTKTHKTDLHIADLPNGFYVLSIKEGKKVLVQKRFIKMDD